MLNFNSSVSLWKIISLFVSVLCQLFGKPNLESNKSKRVHSSLLWVEPQQEIILIIGSYPVSQVIMWYTWLDAFLLPNFFLIVAFSCELRNNSIKAKTDFIYKLIVYRKCLQFCLKCKIRYQQVHKSMHRSDTRWFIRNRNLLLPSSILYTCQQPKGIVWVLW